MLGFDHRSSCELRNLTRRSAARLAELAVGAVVSLAVLSQAGIPVVQGLHEAAHATACAPESAADRCAEVQAGASLASSDHVLDHADGGRTGCAVCQATSHSKSFTSPARGALPGIAPTGTHVGAPSSGDLAAPVLAPFGARAPPSVS